MTNPEKTVILCGARTLLRFAHDMRRREELAYLHAWLARVHPEQLDDGRSRQVSADEYIAANLRGWAVRR